MNLPTKSADQKPLAKAKLHADPGNEVEELIWEAILGLWVKTGGPGYRTVHRAAWGNIRDSLLPLS